MKSISPIQKLFALPLALLSFAFILSVQKAPTADKESTLNEAIAAGSIEADVISNGKYSGKSVKLVLTNLTNKSMKITVPAGTTYVPDDDGEQTLIQLEEDFFVLQPKGTKTHLIGAFCTEATDKCPSDEGKFTISKSSNKKLNEAIAHMKGKAIDKMSYQDIVWAITDGRSISNIEASTPETKEFRTYLAGLTGQEDTWYTSPQQHSLNERRQIVSQTIVVHGQVIFPSDGTSIIRQEVIDESGEVRFALPPSTPRKSAKVTMSFSVRVQGWEAGTYTLRIVKDDVEIKAYPFVLS